MEHRNSRLGGYLAVLMLSPLLAGCGSLSDFSMKDQEWFSRPKMFNSSVSIDGPPLSPTRAVAPDELITAEGFCPGMAASDAAALAPGAQQDGASSGTKPGVVALGHTECDVARGAGVPDNVSLSTGERGERLAVLTYVKGGRPGIYRFTAGRLSSVERGPEPVAEPKRGRQPRPAKRSAS